MGQSPSPKREPMTFVDAIAAVAAGRRVTRTGWNEPSTVVLIDDVVLPDGSQAGRFLAIRRAGGGTTALIVSEFDIVSTDWQIVSTH